MARSITCSKTPAASPSMKGSTITVVSGDATAFQVHHKSVRFRTKILSSSNCFYVTGTEICAPKYTGNPSSQASGSTWLKPGTCDQLLGVSFCLQTKARHVTSWRSPQKRMDNTDNTRSYFFILNPTLQKNLFRAYLKIR